MSFTTANYLIDVKFASGIRNIHFGFTHIHWCVLACFCSPSLGKYRVIGAYTYRCTVMDKTKMNEEFYSWKATNSKGRDGVYCLKKWVHQFFSGLPVTWIRSNYLWGLSQSSTWAQLTTYTVETKQAVVQTSAGRVGAKAKVWEKR